MNESAPSQQDTQQQTLILALLSLIAGAFAGLVGACFRLALIQADMWRTQFVAWAHGEQQIGFVLVISLSCLATLIAAWLVRRFAHAASGSGIPHVEAVLNDELPPAPFSLIPVKFFGGLLAIGSGLALGREGPSVQMGADIAHLVGKLFGRPWKECRVLIAAGAGAGLATAFNAPIAGAIFVFEELERKFETNIAIAALGASATAIFVARLFLGTEPDFHDAILASIDLKAGWLCFVFGALAGVIGVLYNKTLLGTLRLMSRLRAWPIELRAGAIGLLVGAITWYFPEFVGGGDNITQSALTWHGAVWTIPCIFLFRFGLGALSYSAGTPGGLFAPMLALGALFGLLFGLLNQQIFPTYSIQPEAFVIIGMAAFFTAVVRAPLTGIVLVVEMTGNFDMLLPILGGCFTAMMVPTVMRNEPIYDSLSTKNQKKETES
jgi:CIC family chloride channel protein